jgi:hydrogenase-4 membrane subunit HyfE
MPSASVNLTISRTKHYIFVACLVLMVSTIFFTKGFWWAAGAFLYLSSITTIFHRGLLFVVVLIAGLDNSDPRQRNFVFFGEMVSAIFLTLLFISAYFLFY